MSLLESDDFTYYGKGANMPPNVPPRYQEERPAAEPPKARVRSGEMNVDAQKMSGFSLRRKKDKDETKSHKKNKSLGKIQPPDSPKSRSGPSPNTKSSRKKQYAHLLENEPSSNDEDGEEEDDINSGAFVLSKGHQAREKRGSFKSTVVEGEGLPEPTPSSSINPIVADNLFGTSPVKGSGVGLQFPVTFTPPKQPLTTPPETMPPDNFDLILSLSEPFAPDSISLAPPLPPPHAHKSIPPVLQATPTNDDNEWAVTEELYEKCTSQFKELWPTGGLLSGERARDFFLKSTLPVNELSKIWKLSDRDCDGSLTVDEFTIAMKLVLMRRKNYDIPSSLPHQLQVPPALPKPPTEPVRTFNFPPPPPHANKKRSQTTPNMVATPVTVIDPVPPKSTRISPPPIPLLPPFISNTARSKTEPSIAISDAMVDKPHPLDTPTDTKILDNITLEGVPDILTASFMSEGDVPLLLDDSLPPPPLSSDPSPYKEPIVSRLISLEGEESTGDEDETSTLVGGEHPPVPRPRKRRDKPEEKGVASDLYRSQTIHGRITTAPPPRPPPYKKSVSPPPVEDPVQSIATPSPVPESDDRVPIMHPSRPSLPPKPDVKRYSNIVNNTSTTGSDKGHGRSTSWDLSKMLRDEGDMKFHDDVPSAEPPMPPPRRRTDEDGCRSDDDDDGRRGSKIATPLQRSASTGSIASVGLPTIHTVKSRTSSFESSVLLDTDGIELQRSGTMVARRQAPAPPPNKPKKPMYPPSFKKVIMDTSRERSLSGDLEDSLQSAEVYQKKSKTELQKSIRRLKEENNMYISLNKELKKKLIELRQERCRLDTLLKSFSNTH